MFLLFTVIKNTEKQLDGCYSRMLQTTFNIHRQQHLTNAELEHGELHAAMRDRDVWRQVVGVSTS